MNEKKVRKFKQTRPLPNSIFFLKYVLVFEKLQHNTNSQRYLTN